jgi:hypothetical protein
MIGQIKIYGDIKKDVYLPEEIKVWLSPVKNFHVITQEDMLDNVEDLSIYIIAAASLALFVRTSTSEKELAIRK